MLKTTHLPAPETWTPAHSGGHLEPKLRATDKITIEFEPNALVEEKNLCGAAARRAGGSCREHLSDFVAKKNAKRVAASRPEAPAEQQHKITEEPVLLERYSTPLRERRPLYP